MGCGAGQQKSLVVGLQSGSHVAFSFLFVLMNMGLDGDVRSQHLLDSNQEGIMRWSVKLSEPQFNDHIWSFMAS